MNLAQLAETGHVTKVFDPNRTISGEYFELLTKVLHSVPASVNAQSSHYIVASTQQARSRIAAAIGGGFGINTPKILNASHVIVFATRQNLTNEHLDEIHAQEIADGKFPSEEIANQWKAVVRGWIDLHRYDAKDLNHWMEKQTYLAVGVMLMAAEELGINAIPLEGFDSRSLDAELGLREKALPPPSFWRWVTGRNLTSTTRRQNRAARLSKVAKPCAALRRRSVGSGVKGCPRVLSGSFDRESVAGIHSQPTRVGGRTIELAEGHFQARPQVSRCLRSPPQSQFESG
jgi:nitroreductase / dihydropteridine reductase